MRIRRHEVYRLAWGIFLFVVMFRGWTHGLDEDFWRASWTAEAVFVPLGVLLWYIYGRDSLLWEPGPLENQLPARMERMGYVADADNGPHRYYRPKAFLARGMELDVVRTRHGYVLIGQRIDLIRFHNLVRSDTSAE